MIGGTKFYDRAEIKDAIAYLDLLVNPATRRVRAHRQLAAARDRQTRPRRGSSRTRTRRRAVWDAARGPRTCPAWARRRSRRVSRFMSMMERLRERHEAGAQVGDLIQEMLQRVRLPGRAASRAQIESQGRIENLEELVGVGREFDADAPRSRARGFLEQISLLADADNLYDDEGS